MSKKQNWQQKSVLERRRHCWGAWVFNSTVFHFPDNLITNSILVSRMGGSNPNTWTATYCLLPCEFFGSWHVKWKTVTLLPFAWLSLTFNREMWSISSFSVRGVAFNLLAVFLKREWPCWWKMAGKYVLSLSVSEYLLNSVETSSGKRGQLERLGNVKVL